MAADAFLPLFMCPLSPLSLFLLQLRCLLVGIRDGSPPHGQFFEENPEEEGDEHNLCGPSLIYGTGIIIEKERCVSIATHSH